MIIIVILASKLNNPKTSTKAYWSILKSFYSGKKISLIPPLLHNNTLITDFKQKADLFNNFFASQCTTFASNSVFQIFSHTKLIQDFHHYCLRMMIYLN